MHVAVLALLALASRPNAAVPLPASPQTPTINVRVCASEDSTVDTVRGEERRTLDDSRPAIRRGSVRLLADDGTVIAEAAAQCDRWVALADFDASRLPGSQLQFSANLREGIHLPVSLLIAGKAPTADLWLRVGLATPEPRPDRGRQGVADEPPDPWRTGDAELTRLAQGRLAALDAVDAAGQRWTSDDLLGKVTVLQFWSRYCAPCVREVEWLRRMQARHEGDGLQVLGACVEEIPAELIGKWADARRADWPQLVRSASTDTDLVAGLPITGVPQVLVIDRNGTVRATHLHERGGAGLLRRLLRERQPAQL